MADADNDVIVELQIYSFSNFFLDSKLSDLFTTMCSSLNEARTLHHGDIKIVWWKEGVSSMSG